ncbi:hypothetical protein N9O44_00855 [Gammaproteobacteria bacterium]|nr:hypothetical protein [Gammaproteobacteria bacterium]
MKTLLKLMVVVFAINPTFANDGIMDMFDNDYDNDGIMNQFDNDHDNIGW